MRCAIVSDLHANLQAWKAVLIDILKLGADKIICLGDIVGYGPDPERVLESAHDSADYLLIGNHDAAVCGKLDDSLFNDTARTIVDWTRKKLSDKALEFLSKLPLSLESSAFRCSHADIAAPGYFGYMLEPEDTIPSWTACSKQLMFVGHSHIPAIFLLGPSGTPRYVPPQDLSLERGKRYLVNVGSVGQSRDGKASACYCLFDTVSKDLFWRRVPFDVDAYKAAVKKARIPFLAEYFKEGVTKRISIKKMLDFRPVTSADMAVHDVVEVETSNVLKQHIRNWQG